jgi:hypothetical protein
MGSDHVDAQKYIPSPLPDEQIAGMVRFQVSLAGRMKTTVFWDVLCSLVEVY